MGYGFLGYHHKTDNESIFYTSCMYSYQSVFRECFGKEITEFRGKVTKQKIADFEFGVDKLESNSEKFNQDRQQMRGYIDNITFDGLISDFRKMIELMKNKEIRYLSID